MPIAEVQFFDVVKWLHITAVIVGFGATFAYGIFISAAAKSEPRSMPGVIAGIQATDRMLLGPGIGLIILTGLYMTIDRWEFSDFFVGWGILAVIVLGAMGGLIFNPNEEKAAAAAKRDVEAATGDDVEFSPEFNRANSTMARAGMLAGLIIVLTVYVMTAKPFL